MQEARRKLDILEKIYNDPQLILTDLFSEDISDMNFLRQIDINGKDFFDYLKEGLNSIHPFKNCVIKNNSHRLYVFSFYLPSLKVGKYSEYTNDDLIAKIDVNDRTYRIFTKSIKCYEEVMNKEYKLKEATLSDWWQRFTDLSFKNRLYQINEVVHSDKNLFVKISDTYFWLVMTNKRRRKIQDALNRENKKIENSNQYNKSQYEENIERQAYYKEHAPTHIEKIKKVQKEIEMYMKEIGYTEDLEISEY